MILWDIYRKRGYLTPPGASAGRKSPKTFLTVDPRGRSYAKRHQKTLVGAQAFGVYGTVTLFWLYSEGDVFGGLESGIW